MSGTLRGGLVNPPCRCIQPGPLTDHDGHCCLAEWDVVADPLPTCHPRQWRDLRDRTRRPL